MEMNYCRRCGTELTKKNDVLFKCANDHSSYINASPTAGIFFIAEDGQIVLSRRGIEPDKGMLDSFGGFVDSHESAEEAIVREVTEETGLSQDFYSTPQLLCTAPSLYRFEDENRPVLSTFFYSTLRADAELVAADDVSEIVYVDIDELNVEELGGDDVKLGIQQLKRLLKTT